MIVICIVKSCLFSLSRYDVCESLSSARRKAKKFRLEQKLERLKFQIVYYVLEMGLTKIFFVD